MLVRNIKALGLALVAVLAMGAVAAAGAQAAIHLTTSQSGTDVAGTISGTQTVKAVLSTPKGQVECNKATFAASTATGTNMELTVTPTYEECEGFGLPATVTMNGCEYTLATPTVVAADEYTGEADLVCPANTLVEVHVYLFKNPWESSLCTVTIGNAAGGTSGPFGHIIYTDETNTPTSANTILLHLTLGNIPVQEHGTCPDATTTAINGSLTGTVKVSATAGGNPADMELTSAQAEKFTTKEENGTHVSGTLSGFLVGTNVLKMPEGKVECTTATFAGKTAIGEESDVTLEPTFSGCEGFGFPATVTMNGCTYTLTTPAKVKADEYTGNVDMVCPGTSVVEIHIYIFKNAWSSALCTIIVKPATELGTVTYTDKTNTKTSANALLADWNVSSIPVELHGTCPESATVLRTNGSLTGR